MLAVERRKLFLTEITEKGNATVSYLANLAGVTEETVRRDLQVMESDGTVIKTHGGAVLNQGNTVHVSSDLRQKINYREKTRIAKEACKLIQKNDVIYLDSSTTSLFLAKELKKMSDITVVTNSLHVLNEFASTPSIKIISTGGTFVHKNQSFVGATAQAFIAQNYYVNKAFFSCRGVSKDGVLLESDEQEAAIKAQMLNVAQDKILIVDNSKFGRFGSVKLCDITEVTLIITDNKKSANFNKGIKPKKIVIAQ